MTEDEMVGWHHCHNGHGFGWTLGVGNGQVGLACCESWGRKESDTTEWLNWTELMVLRRDHLDRRKELRLGIILADNWNIFIVWAGCEQGQGKCFRKLWALNWELKALISWAICFDIKSRTKFKSKVSFCRVVKNIFFFLLHWKTFPELEITLQLK